MNNSSNALISYPDRTLAAMLTGGSWGTTLNNLKDPMLSRVSRTTDDMASSSVILIDLGAPRDIRVISLCAHNITAAGTVRARGFSGADYDELSTEADTDIAPAWPAGFTAQNVADYPKNLTFCFDGPRTAQYWMIEIDDPTNPDGYIQLGRCWIGDAFEPETGVSYGMSLGYESRDVIEESLGGVPWGEKRTPRRSLVATFMTVTPVEKRMGLILQKVLTETSEAFWVSNAAAIPDDMLLEAFPCFFRKPSPLTYPYFNNNEMPISVIERV